MVGSLRDLHVARLAQLLPEHRARIEWPAERIAAERVRALRALVSGARERSQWHRERLVDIDLDALDPIDLRCLPVMTKTDLMDSFDEIVTDPRVTRDLCEAHLRHNSAGYLLDEYRVVTSGGSSGVRGVFVYGWDAWATCYSSIVRFQQRDWEADPALADVPRVTAVVGASHATHMSAALGQTFSSATSQRHLFPVDDPIAAIVDGLNRLQPTILMAYSSYLPHLIDQVQRGQLRIAPRRVIAISEPLLLEVRAAVDATWNVPVASGYGMSEGVFAGSCGHSLHLPDDLCVIEPVTANGEPVPTGERADRILVTNLYNHLLPLIRFDVTDQIVVLPDSCPCGSTFSRVADPQGRLDDTFSYAGGVTVHPHVFRTTLASESNVIEYQVHQTAQGAEVRIVGAVNADRVKADLERALRQLGVTEAVVTVASAASLGRQPSGKLKRFVPLPP